MPTINPHQAVRHTQRLSRRRGSILIMVVALLTLIALIGTALIATARTDRYTTSAYVDAATQDATHQQFVDQAVSLVEDSLKNDQTRGTDSPTYDTWLADRLPTRLDPASPVSTSNPPVWRHLTGRLVTDSNVKDTDFPTPADFQPPFQISSTAPVTPAAKKGSPSYIKMVPVGPNTPSTAVPPVTSFYSAAPSSISITYLPTHPVESIRNQTRTYPALTFYDSTGAIVSGTNTFLAGDADGDGIADAALFRLSPTPVDGVTYYAAVRVIDNNSAVNVNTAWSRDLDFDATGAQVNPTGFFPSGVGLYELLSQNTDTTTSRVDRDNEIAELNEYRFGYPKDQKATNNWTDAFQDFSTTSQPTVAGLTPVEDPEPDTSPTNFGNGDKPTVRNDFAFTTQGEALFMQLGRRIDNPGFNSDPAYTPTASTYFPSPTAGTPFGYRGYSLTDASSAALAYHFLMANPDASASDLELRLRKSIYESAPNYTDYPRGSGKLPGYGFSGDTKVHHWSAFPANESLLWFQYLDYTLVNTSVAANDPQNTNFTPTRPAGNSGPVLTGPTQFRSVRPLLTTYSATSNLIPPAALHTNLLYSWDQNTADPNMLYPGMLSEDMSTHVKASAWTGSPSQPYKMFDMVFDDKTGLTYMRVSDKTDNPSPWVLTYPASNTSNCEYRYWQPQPRVSARAKANPNLAGFPELWRAFFNLMTEGAPTIDGGTPVDATYMAEVQGATGATPATVRDAFYPAYGAATAGYYDIYRGMHWDEDYGKAINPSGPDKGTAAKPLFEPRQWTAADASNSAHSIDVTVPETTFEQNSLRMFRSPIRDPRTPSAASVVNPGLHRLTPLQVMALRSAIAANNTKQMLSHGTDVVTRTITLYDVDPNQPNPPTGSPTPGTPVPQYEVTLYGTAPQPFITEVYASNDNYQYKHHDTTDDSVTATYENTTGFIAIELYNPYDVPIDLTGFRIANIPRDATYGPSGMTLGTATPPAVDIGWTPTAANTIPPKSYMTLINHGAGASKSTGNIEYIPPSIRGIVNPVIVNGLSKFLGDGGATPGELVLLRPRVLTDTTESYQDLVPVDQYDFTGFPALSATITDAKTVWHYARNSPNAGAVGDWQWVYPGRYDASVAAPDPRQQGTQRTPLANHTYTPSDVKSAGSFDPWIDPVVLQTAAADAAATQADKDWYDIITYGSVWAGNVAKTPAITLGSGNPMSTYDDAVNGGHSNAVSIPLDFENAPGPNPVGPPYTAPQTTNQFPFGGFARNGDILHVPYISAYRIRRLQPSTSGLVTGKPVDPGALADPATDIVEWNAVTMDAAFAEDTDVANNAHSPAALIAGQENVGRFTPNTAYSTWSNDLLSYLAVNTPSLDYLPDTDPYTYKPGITSTYGGTGNVTDMPQPVSNHTPGVANANTTDSGNEDGVGTQGLININTASAKVLSLLPWIPNTSTGKIDVTKTEDLANKIVDYRQKNGDFASIFDLDKVPEFKTAAANLVSSGDPDKNAGDISGLNATTPDGVRYDFEEQYLLLDRVSNLITTTSDTYTVYILVQGWRDAGTPYPVLDWEKRVAYIMDRSSGTLKKVAVPTE